MTKDEIIEIFKAFGWREKLYHHKDILKFHFGEHNHAAVYFPSVSVVFTDYLNRPVTLRETSRETLCTHLKNIYYGQ